ncbi:hypothetical protein CcI49_25140 [Frankia sp. CcI49]|uniref:polysaccharide lyase n=1 Tax=unclassified Frankia TaxID=2632575 RepID=UPI0006CA0417|nr:MULTISPECIES: hypothetical protein [unclassified Frankia]KPM52822.1 hypothetical protein ACG83_25610 [Frankia sp. R43]ONH57749.1 hypothetical protein CcI49_25140 [Frankia sp. CcI49]
MSSGGSRRALLASTVGSLALAAATGCGILPADRRFDPASEVLPPDTTASPAAAAAPVAARGRTLADPAASREFFGKALVPTNRMTFGLDRAEIMRSDDPRFPSFLRVSLPVDAANPDDRRIYRDGTTYGGTQLFVDHTLRSPYELYLRYYLRFPEAFDFGKGGRLPGFFGTIVKNRERTETLRSGLATRFAWREGGAGLVYANTARPDHPLNVIGKASWYWPTGRWVCVEQGVKLNFEGFADGVILIWLDGALAHKEKFNPRISNDLRIGGFLLQAAFGDGGSAFAPTAPQTLDLAGFTYGTARLNPLPRPEKT